MGSEVKVWVYSDRVHADTGEKVEADHVRVPLRLGKHDVLIDLTDAEWKELNELLGPWLKVGYLPNKVNTGPRHAGRHPNAYYIGLRQYCAEQGRPLKPDAEGKYTYPDDMRREYEAMLAARTQGQA